MPHVTFVTRRVGKVVETYKQLTLHLKLLYGITNFITMKTLFVCTKSLLHLNINWILNKIYTLNNNI